MRTRLCGDDSFWHCEITLDEKEWPDLDEEGRWMQRPIRMWVHENSQGNYFFADKGWILLERREDAIMFKLTWG